MCYICDMITLKTTIIMMKKVMELWKKWLGKRDVSVVENVAKEISIKTEKNVRKSSLLEDLEIYLFKVYDFRFNVLTEQTEYRKKGESVFHLVDQRVLNTLCMKVRKQGINCWDKDVSRLLLSPTEIFCRLQKKYPAAFRGSNVVNMGRMLIGLGVERVRTRYGSAYRVALV